MAKDTQVSDPPSRRRKIIAGEVPQRIPVTGSIPGFHLHVVNDAPGRIAECIQRGYEFVDRTEALVHNILLPDQAATYSEASHTAGVGDDRIRFWVGTDERGDPLFAFLMKTRTEWHEEDMAAYNKVQRELMTARPNAPHSYIGREGISVTTEVR